MSDWDRLSPLYLSDFFAVWYDRLGLGVLFVVLFVLPLLLVLFHYAEPELRKGLGKSPPDPIRFLFALVRPSPARSSALKLFLLGAFLVSLVYLYFHWRISANPSVLTDTEESLQALGRADVVAAIEFLQRWAAVGWTLMFVVLSLTFAFLSEGWHLLPDAPIPLLTVSITRESTDTHYKTKVEHTEVRLTVDSDVYKLATKTSGSANDLVNFSYRQDGNYWCMFHSGRDQRASIQVTVREVQVHLFGRLLGRLLPNRSLTLTGAEIRVPRKATLTWVFEHPDRGCVEKQCEVAWKSH
ncbi:hypothetical protein [Promineifilum sp.]|uniref:hypothetical protein n=1 Tax=Promineifilum sp. TaxID=2664178 RepID=UPI0035B3E4E1